MPSVGVIEKMIFEYGNKENVVCGLYASKVGKESGFHAAGKRNRKLLPY